MDLETLKKMLAEGKITQTEFDAKVKELGLDKEGEKAPELTDALKGYIAGLIQSETDKVRTEYSKKLKEKEDEIKRIQEESNTQLKSKMTEAEKLAFEKKLQDEQYEKEKADFLKQKRDFNATKLLNKYGLLDEELSFLDLVADDDENAIDLRCQKLKNTIDAKVKEAVAQTFKDNGRDFGGSDGGSGSEQKDKDVEFGKKLAENKKQEVEASKKAEQYYFGEK